MLGDVPADAAQQAAAVGPGCFNQQRNVRNFHHVYALLTPAEVDSTRISRPRLSLWLAFAQKMKNRNKLTQKLNDMRIETGQYRRVV